MRNSKFIIGFVIMAVMIMGMRYAYFIYVKHHDKQVRPWAYADHNGYSLVGTWKGQCKDADGNTHDVTYQIENPFSESKAKSRIFSKRIKRDRSGKFSFNGSGEITYNGRNEKMILSGHVNKEDFHKVYIDTRPEDDKHHTGFNVNLTSGTWHENKLTLDVTFSFYTPEGFSRYESDNVKHQYIGKLEMKKM